jgi:hypothetical protein
VAQAKASVAELVGMVERGEIRLPEMQRRYVWRAPRVRDLLDSLYRCYPSGAILLWETDLKVAEREFAVEQKKNAFDSNKLLLDGQQRLTSLSSVLRGVPIKVAGRKRPIELLFNLEHPDTLTLVTEVDESSDDEVVTESQDATEEEMRDEIDQRIEQMTFVVATKKLARRPYWVSVTDVFRNSSDAAFLRKAGVSDFDDPRFQKYSERLNALRDIAKYTYRMDILERHLSYEEVTEIFVRVNSLGAKLRGSDLALAQITARWNDSLKLFEAFQKTCADKGFETELGTFVRSLVVMATGQSRFKTVNSIPDAALKEAWGRAVAGIEFALNFLRSNLQIESIVLLSSPYILVALAYYGDQRGYQLDAEGEQLLRFWCLVANMKGRYSRGSSETMLDQDLTAIRAGEGIAGMLNNVRKQFGRLKVEPGDLAGRNQRSSYFKTMFMAFRHDGARDWHSRLSIAVDHSGSTHKLQFHHVFPKAKLRGLKSTQAINDIANLSFIGGKTNRRISDRLPSAYLPDIFKADRKLLGSQQVPLEPALWELDAYDDFLKQRRLLIANRLNAWIEECGGDNWST